MDNRDDKEVCYQGNRLYEITHKSLRDNINRRGNKSITTISFSRKIETLIRSVIKNSLLEKVYN